MSIASRYAAWQRRLSIGQALAVIVLAIASIGASALAAALLPSPSNWLAAGVISVTCLIFCARLPRRR
jgi:hypothetical protein